MRRFRAILLMLVVPSCYPVKCIEKWEPPECNVEPSASGEIRWEYSLEDAYDFVTTHITRLDSAGNSYLAGTRTFDISGEQLVVVKFSADGDEWVAKLDTIQDGPTPLINVVYILQDGGVLAATSEGHMYRIDAMGEIVWKKVFEGADKLSFDANEHGFAILNSDGCCQHTLYRYNLDGLLTLIKPVDPGMVFLHDNDEISIVWGQLVKRLSSYGEAVWSRAFSIEGCDYCELFRVSKLADRGFAYLFVEYFHGSLPDYYSVRLDGDGRVLWRRKLDPLENAYLMAELPGERTLFGGMSCDTPERGHDAVLYAFDKEGNKSWERWFGGDGWEGTTAMRIGAGDCITVAAVRDRDLWVFGFSYSDAYCSLPK